MQKTTFEVSQMDCPSEEALIRMKLESISGIQCLNFDIPKRRLEVIHFEDLEKIEQGILDLNLGGKRLNTVEFNGESIEKVHDQKQQRKLLWAVLIINFGFFIIEMVTGFISRSMGLVADSLDMLADSLVYGLSLLVVGSSIIIKKRVARVAGYLQITLASVGLFEVMRRFIYPELSPDFRMMISISFIALLANTVSLFLLQKSKSKEAHMQASMIFTSNDIIINLGVILAGGLVYWLQSSIPDLVIGTLVFIIVIKGAYRILRLGN
ncbi:MULTISPECIES: cation transporter [unclassified Lentimicrobium]|uniref:cation transporter n=1 Tax=unclassified Lentimicrobium TaxID=2677434 RepID=UPI00155455C2|nr:MULTISPECIES: cation transporter [unclassified Lentimicrobium]NPD46292.1 cation transporter [Lentimicrobium sp. S6]NPD85316.1 cation transporter [Lentimicrobium sp. L6]